MSFEILPGDAGSPVVVHVPHSSRTVPAEARASILLDDPALEAELDAMTDARTDELAERALALSRAAGAPAAWRFVNRLSRLVVDPERFLDPELEEMAEIGMGAVYTATSRLAPLREPDAERDAAFVERWFDPYAEALADLVDERLASLGRCVVIDLHSYPRDVLPYERHPGAARPAVCLGTDPRHTPGWLLAAAREAFTPMPEVATDEPFVGTYVPTRHFGRDDRVASLMVELRRDSYADPAGTERVATCLAALVQAVTTRAP